jgi:hypothetical protein
MTSRQRPGLPTVIPARHDSQLVVGAIVDDIETLPVAGTIVPQVAGFGMRTTRHTKREGKYKKESEHG